MWRVLGKLAQSVVSDTCFLNCESVLHQQRRSTFILKRRNAVPLSKKGENPKRLKAKHFIYDLVKNENKEKQPDIEVILTSYVDGLGNISERVLVNPTVAYNELLLPGLAVYATPENVEKYRNYEIKEGEVRYSSKMARTTMLILAKVYLSVIMNMENPWTLQPWHVSTSFRKCGYIVPKEAIELPPEPIKGPNMDFEHKDFYVIVTINKTEKVTVRCRLHHWSTEMRDRLPHVHEFWKTPVEPIHPEFAPILAKLPSRAVLVEQPVD